jgi:hypothetical protein
VHRQGLEASTPTMTTTKMCVRTALEDGERRQCRIIPYTWYIRFDRLVCLGRGSRLCRS